MFGAIKSSLWNAAVLTTEFVTSLVATDGFNAKTKTRYQIKIGTGGDVLTATGLSGLTFNNLTVGKTYKIVLRLRTINTVTIFAYSGGFINSGQSLPVIAFMGNCNIGNVNVSNDEIIFVATSPTISINYAGSGINASPALSTLRIEELPNHEVTVAFT